MRNGWKRSLWITPALLALLTAGSFAQDAAPAPQNLPSANVPGPGDTQGAAAPLRVMVGKSLLINTSERLKRISVTDDAVAEALVVTPTQILVHGRAPGDVSLLIRDELERSRSFDLRVDVDVSSAREEMGRIFPEERITVSPSRNAIVLSGHVNTEDAAKRAGMIAEAYSKNVVNVLTFGPVGAQEVLLEVKFAEVDRTALTQIGFNLLSTGAGGVLGNISTGQFGGTKVGEIKDIIPIKTTPFPDVPAPVTGPAHTGFESTTTVSDLLNIFLFSPQLHIGTVIKALQQRNLLEILAEPNLIAVNGKEASFLAGGEFPFPVVQPSGGTTAVTVQFKEFGVRLKFTPLITPSGLIHLHVAPEVSTIDLANAVTVANTTIPALSTRKAETELELQDGQSFIIAGLMDNRVTTLMNKVPGFGDIPILGNFFRSKSRSKTNSELIVLVTARRISPSTGMVPLPSNPETFLDKQLFDGKNSKDNKDDKDRKETPPAPAPPSK